MLVNYDVSTNTLRIYAEVYESEHPRALPNRMFSSKYKCWLAPCTYMNAKIITSEWGNKIANIDSEANEAMVRVLDTGNTFVRKPFPETHPFKYKPYDIQKKCLDHVYSLERSALFVPMGLGKSKISIDKITCHYKEGKLNAVIILCPCTLRFNWCSQLKEHMPEEIDCEVVSLDIKNKKNIRDANRLSELKTSALKVLIVGIESFSSAKAQLSSSEFIGLNKTALIIDEAHFVKNDSAIRTKVIRKITANIDYRIIMTGTPIEQGIMDLYSQFYILDPSIIGIGDFWSFKRRYAVMGGYEKKNIIGYKNIDELMELIKPFVFQCTKEEAFDFPPKTFQKRHVTLLPEQLRVYKELKKNRLVKLKDDEDMAVTNALSLYSALQQIVGGFVTRGTGEYGANGLEIREKVSLVPPEKNPKIKELKAFIEQLPNTEQVIIWAKYRFETFQIAEALTGFMTGEFENDIELFLDKTDSERKDIIDRMANKKSRYFISTQKSGGTGITLTSVAYVVYFSNRFEYGARMQSEDRNHRIGQLRPVTYVDIVAENTVDTRILDVLEKKGNMADYIKGELKTGGVSID